MLKVSHPSLISPKGYEGYDVILIMSRSEKEDATLQYAVGVSSTVLTIASPVFDAMFNGPFAEGQITVNGPRTFELPKDDILGS